jgi:hypothetical protein
MCEVPPKRGQHLTHRAASRCCHLRSSFGWGMLTILVADVNVVAALICEMLPKRQRHLTHHAANPRHCSRSLFRWRTSTLFCRQGCLSRAHPCNNITLLLSLTVVVPLAPSTINTTATTTATTAGTTTMMTDSTASLCSHGCPLVAWAAAAAVAESMLRQQRQLGTRDSNGNGNGAAAAGQWQWWQQWRSAMEKRSLSCILADSGSALADSGSALADSGSALVDSVSALADLGCTLMTWAAPS